MQKTAYESRISDWSSDVCSSDLKLGISAHRVPLGVDLRAWPPMPPRRRGAGRAKLIHVASLNRVKDQATLLRALSILARAGHEFTMDVVGVDTLHGEVQRLATELGLESRVRFRGFRTQRELRPMLAAAALLDRKHRPEAGPPARVEATGVRVPPG